MTDGETTSGSPETLERMTLRLREIAQQLADPDTPDGQAVALAQEAATLVGQALEETERAVAGLEQGD